MKVHPDVVAMGHEEFEQAADQYVLNQYLIEQSQECYAPVKNLTKYRVHRILREQLLKLPTQTQRIVRLCYWSDFTVNEIAEDLNLPEPFVAEQLQLGLEHLRAGLFREIRHQCRFSLKEVECMLEF